MKQFQASQMLWTGLILLMAVTPILSYAEIVKSKTIDDGSSGPFKAAAATESTLPDYVVYRPVDINAAFQKEGKLPVLVFANGGCSDTSISHERLLSEIASHGYVVIAIGALQMTPGERRGRQTEATLLIDAIDWVQAQYADKSSDYYQKVDLNKIAAGGQSCGDAQILAAASDPRIKTWMMFNSGMGEMSMAGASQESLKTLHGPIVYIVGGSSDVATANARMDYETISHVPVAFANLENGGHMGTFGEKYGGSFSRMALAWLDWQFKGQEDPAAVFLKNDLETFPGWTMKAKNFGAESTDKAVVSEPVEITVTKDIPYREGNSDAWKLDIAMPCDSGDALRPAFVIVHGGGWASGSKSVDVYQKMMVDYARKGYVTINVEYRLTGEAPFPACIEDCKCAVRWLRAHADQYRIDPDRIGAYGHSAGAHLALMLAMAPHSAGLEGDGGWDAYSSRVNAAAAGSPPTELGRNVEMAQEQWWPIGYISADQPPLFLIQGSDDRIVRPVLTDYFVEKMRIAGARIDYLKIDGVGHGVAYAEKLEITDPAIEEFFARHLKPIASETASRTVEDGGTGPWPALMATDGSLPTHTIFRPKDLRAFSQQNPLPIIAWGNGACANSPWEHVNFLSEVASYGFLVIAIGPMPEAGQRGGGRSTSSQLIDAIDWAIAQNDDKTSQYYNKLDITKISVSGMSCGGLQTLEVAPDPRITTAVICNSGILPNPGAGMPGMPGLTKNQLEKLHSPTLYLLGGESDIAYNNGMDDFRRINHVPVFAANLNVGHGGTYAQSHGGDFAKVATAWYQWQLKDDREAAKMFTGEPCGVAQMSGWKAEKKNIP